MTKKLNLNPKVVARLEAGMIRQILLGEGECFIPDYTYRSHHDAMFVMYILLHWAIQNDRIEQASADLADLCQTLIENKQFEDVKDVLLAYDITSRDQKIHLSFNFDSWYAVLPAELKWKRTEQGKCSEHKTLLR
jgi:hypothetical protein